MTENIETLTKTLYAILNDIRLLLGLSEEWVMVKCSYYSWGWHVEVRPTLLTFGAYTNIFTRGFSSGSNKEKDLKNILKEAISESLEQLELLKEGKTRGL
jgi:hypothetical protein